MKYPIRDHARGAASHTLFGIVTDLGTRLLSPWRDEVVIERGPSLSERLDRSQAYLGQGREYLQQGIGHANRLAEQARSRWPEIADAARRGGPHASELADTVPSRQPDYADAADFTRSGRQRARQFAADVRSQVPGINPADVARAGRRQASGLLDDAQSYVP